MKTIPVFLMVAAVAFVAGRHSHQTEVQAEEKGNLELPETRTCGDVNGDGRVNVSDVPHLIHFLFLGGEDLACEGPAPGFPGCVGDPARFISHGDGTVTDTCTGLMWQSSETDVNGDGRYRFDDDRLTFDQAAAFCEDLTFAGHDDWRLPTIEEIFTIINYLQENPAVYREHFESPGRENWALGGERHRQIVRFADAGSIDTRHQDGSTRFPFRAVRNAP